MRKVLVLLVLFVLAVPVAWIAGQGSELMTMEISSVRTSSFPKLIVTANVYDAQGQPVRGLVRENFAIKGDLAGLVTVQDVENVTDDNLPLATVLAIDTSFSMDGTPIERARAAAQLFVDSLRPNDEVAIVTFGTTTTVVQEFTTDRDRLSRAIASLTPAGQTALYQGAYEAVRLAANSPIPRRAVILLSDGAEYGGRSEVTREDAILEAGPNDVPVYTIGLGFGADRTYLAELSGGTNALFFESPSPDQLDQIYTDLSALFRSQYILTLEASVPGDGQEYLLRLQAETAIGGAAAEEIFRAPILVPIVRVLDVPNRLITAPVSFTVDVLADDELTQVTVDSGDGASPLAEFTSPYEVTIDPQTLAPGPRAYTVRATDETGDVGEARFTVEIAALPPIATITNLQPGETLRESRTVNVTYESQTPVIRVNFLLDEADYGQRLSPPYEAPLDVFQLNGGGHILSVIAENAAGITSRQDIAFTVDEAIGLTLTALVPTNTPTPTTPPLGTTPGEGDAILPALTGTAATGVPGAGAQATINAQSTAVQVAAIGTADARATDAQVITNATADAQATADFRSTFEAANAAATESAATSEAEIQATQESAQATAAAVNESTAAAVTAQVQATATQAAVITQQAEATAIQVAAAATADAQTQATANAATATAEAATAQALQTQAVEQTQVANLQATQTTIAQVVALRQTADAQATQDIGATQTVNAATQAAASATRAAATVDAQATLNAMATQTAFMATEQSRSTELAATLSALETLAAATDQAIATQTAAASTQAAQTQAALDAQAAQTAAAATQQALATEQAATQNALATEQAATEAAAATLALQFTQTAAASATRAAATEQAATQRALATENALASQTALAAATRSSATEAAQTQAIQATQTAAIIATTAAAPSVTPSITATLQLEEVVTQSPPIPTDLLPLTCVIGLIAGVMAVIFVLIGGSQRRRDRRR
ncbi:MAG: VWA domain-containing protein [Anaerolineae bacterium]|nr:VWA domain-containing protein [Anaerolineae bacterium]